MAPLKLYQFYIIHGWYKNVMFPCAFVLLTAKDCDSYKAMISKLIEEALLIKCILRPNEVLLDFKKAAINAFSHFFQVMILGCFFHFGECLFKNLCLHGMKTQYGHDEKLRTWLKSMISLVLVPTTSVQDQFVDLLEQSQGNFKSVYIFFTS